MFNMFHHSDNALPGAVVVATTKTIFEPEAQAMLNFQPHLDESRIPKESSSMIYHDEAGDHPNEKNISNGENPFEVSPFKGFGENDLRALHGDIATPSVVHENFGKAGCGDCCVDPVEIFGSPGPHMD